MDLLAVQGTLESLLQHRSSKALILQCSAFFIVQLSHPYMTAGKTIALTRLTFVGIAMTGEPRGFYRVTAGFSSYDGEFRLPLVLAQASPIFHSSCEGKLGIALE